MHRQIYITRVTYCLSLTMIVLLLNACSSDSFKQEEERLSTFFMKIGEKEVLYETTEPLATANCEQTFASAYFTTEDGYYSFSLMMTNNGRIKRLRVTNAGEGNFAGADFLSGQYFEVSNIFHDPIGRRLYFDFSGTLFEINNASNTLEISGSADFFYYPETSCSPDFRQMEAMVNEYNFQSVVAESFPYSSGDRWHFYCDNGYYMSMELENSIFSMPLGTYTFTTEDIHNRIDIEKYIGDVKASAFEIPPHLLNEWQTYNTAGVFEITEKYVDENGTPVINGSFSLQAYDEDTSELVYEISNGTFSL